MAGYIRNDTSNNIATGNVINASDLDGEFDAIQAAFVNTTGHTHDGTAAEGAPITKVGPAQDLVVATGSTTPKTNNVMDLGSNSLKFKDVYAAGTAYIATLDLTNALTVADGGTGITTFPALSLPVASTLNTLSALTATAGQSVRVNAGGTAWETYTPSTGTGDAVLANNNAFTGANTFYNSTGQTFGTGTSTQDGIVLAGRAGGSSSFRVTMQPTTLGASRTLTLPDNSGTVLTTGATVTVAQGGTGATTLTGVLKGNGTSAFTAATANTDYVTSTGADGLFTRWMFQDTGWDFHDSGTTNALNYVNGSVQRWAPNTGSQTLSITNWPPSGAMGELLIEGINLGAATITWPTINWIKTDGTTTTTFSSNGVTLQTSGTDWVFIWTRDGGTTLYGKVVR